MPFLLHSRSFLSFSALERLKRSILCLLFAICTFQYAQGEVQSCQYVQPAIQGVEPENCSLVCSLTFQHAVAMTSSDEITLCGKNTTLAVFCVTHNDCRQYHVGAYCKVIPCLCRLKTGPPEAYIFPYSGANKINTCVVSSKYMNPDNPIVPFPWKTLLVVCAIVFVFAAFLICLRWVSPLIRSMHAKRSTRNARERQAPPPEDNASLCPQSSQSGDATPFTYYIPQGMPRIYRASPQRRSQRNHRSSARARYIACAQADGTLSGTLTLSNEDKPPPYETAIQLPPPTYEDVERAIIESRRRSSSHPRELSDQRVEVHPVPQNLAPSPPSLPTVS